METIGFDAETVKYKNTLITAGDVGREDEIHAILKHYYQNISGIIFAVNSNDCERMNDSCRSFNSMTEDELIDAILLPNIMSVSETTEGLGLNQFFATLILIAFIDIKTIDDCIYMIICTCLGAVSKYLREIIFIILSWSLHVKTNKSKLQLVE